VEPVKPGTVQGPLIGRWTYRSFVGNPDIDADFGSLEFGRGELVVEYVCPGTFIGRLIFDDAYQFRLQGVANPGDPPTIRFRGVGDAADSAGQIYDYFGCLMPLWSYPTRKRLVIVGSTVRAVAHNGEAAFAGQAASFIAIKRDVYWEPEPSPAQQPAPAQPTEPTGTGEAGEAGGTEEAGETGDTGTPPATEETGTPSETEDTGTPEGEEPGEGSGAKPSRRRAR
jgi:hypothetical protein